MELAAQESDESAEELRKSSAALAILRSRKRGSNITPRCG
eukprot:CAMPEP_0176128596 /NCGR_PEP_ID=MMETSP0120_2-20121206/64986_1 /TAXON_ID=160619 /ORGANISM="Kryptoperidinium foliaceum, Strain CCMP 1326" /LENGTH=39 /DNA_ID= /DNA_START= /DNA_END= /DNA_ORIENTATION=